MYILKRWGFNPATLKLEWIYYNSFNTYSEAWEEADRLNRLLGGAWNISWKREEA